MQNNNIFAESKSCTPQGCKALRSTNATSRLRYNVNGRYLFCALLLINKIISLHLSHNAKQVNLLHDLFWVHLQLCDENHVNCIRFG